MRFAFLRLTELSAERLELGLVAGRPVPAFRGRIIYMSSVRLFVVFLNFCSLVGIYRLCSCVVLSACGS